MNDPKAFDLTSCDLEPIHIPGSIQPYGVMLVADPRSGEIVGYAGTGNTSDALLGRNLADLIGHSAESIVPLLPRTGLHVIGEVGFGEKLQDAVAYRSGEHLVVELTDRADGTQLGIASLALLDTLEARLERTVTIEALSTEAARVFQQLTGYSRVMLYRFLDGDAGVVLGESISDQSPSFMHHHFPASDIPRQARALYVRNKVRVIADVGYEPAPIVSASSDLTSIDLSDSTLRSVSPIHIQYLKNMGVAASASMSIVKDGMLWGLIACHHHEVRPLSLNTRIACQSMAASLARMVKSREENELYRERVKLRAQEDSILSHLGGDHSLTDFFARSGEDLAKLLDADGFAAVQGGDLFRYGHCPDPADIRAIADYVRVPALLKPVATRELSAEFPIATDFRDSASGLVAVTMSTEVPTILMWFRVEQLQVVKWAGNPHKDVPHEPGATLTPRASFEEWSENVRGRSREWSLAETESAARVVKLLLEARNNGRIRQLNRELTTTLRENEQLIAQKDFLLREVNHRVQNSLSLVAAFLRMQGRAAGGDTKDALEQAQHRLMAVSLAHRRLYQDDSVEIIDLSRYLEELATELLDAMDTGWRHNLHLDLAPILISTDRAVSVGLVVNELLTNITKYAYGGVPGPAVIKLEQHRTMLRLIIADSGRGMGTEVTGTGFGSKMLSVLVRQLQGTLDYEDNLPGTRAVMTAPIKAQSESAN
ncbi:histidine kinase dimerization/phosphoacceptor domain -containing protein [Devosia soli]|uniref:histidine kinase dimerization/phosphoacceptor domain -containing protein n=1 Tax=Devosia soli TaxID=361041 RepID=UPI000B0F7B5F|nr:histidine kinase dimerization/phosphoacceptor domain -containing protein [Devosia soli]